MLRRGFYALLMMLAAAGSLLAFGAAPAQAANLYHCATSLDPGRTRACTTITSAPSTGVEVLDRYNGTRVRLYNGNSVVLHKWKIDDSGLCGVHGDKYVWTVLWTNASGRHWAVIGDYYLATGAVSNWNDFTDAYGNLGNYWHYKGHGSGACNVFPAPL